MVKWRCYRRMGQSIHWSSVDRRVRPAVTFLAYLLHYNQLESSFALLEVSLKMNQSQAVKT
jgi:hypothetical protein